MADDKAITRIEHESFLRGMAGVINKLLKETHGHNIGFALITIESGEPGLVDYISNVKRKTMIDALREAADRIESNQDMPASIGSA